MKTKRLPPQLWTRQVGTDVFSPAGWVQEPVRLWNLCLGQRGGAAGGSWTHPGKTGEVFKRALWTRSLKSAFTSAAEICGQGEDPSAGRRTCSGLLQYQHEQHRGNQRELSGQVVCGCVCAASCHLIFLYCCFDFPDPGVEACCHRGSESWGHQRDQQIKTDSDFQLQIMGDAAVLTPSLHFTGNNNLLLLKLDLWSTLRKVFFIL